jgi:transposase
VLRVKALIAYYKGMSAETVAACYDVSLKTLKGWIKKFEAERSLSNHNPVQDVPPNCQVAKVKN